MRIGSPAVEVVELPLSTPNRWCDACPSGQEVEPIYKLHIKAGDFYTDRTSKVCRNHLAVLAQAITVELNRLPQHTAG